MHQKLGLKNDIKQCNYEIINYIKMFFSFVPVQSYLKCRRLLLLGYNRLVIQKQEVVDIL